MNVLARVLSVSAVGAATVAALFAGAAIASVDDVPTEVNGGSIVEDFNHPGAAEVLANYGLKLYKGNGSIVWTETRKLGEESPCPVGVIQVNQLVGPNGAYHCFKTVGGDGYLTLEIPGTFGIRGGVETIEATANLPEGPEQFTIPPNSSVPINPGSGSDHPEAVLVELRIN